MKICLLSHFPLPTQPHIVDAVARQETSLCAAPRELGRPRQRSGAVGGCGRPRGSETATAKKVAGRRRGPRGLQSGGIERRRGRLRRQRPRHRQRRPPRAVREAGAARRRKGSLSSGSSGRQRPRSVTRLQGALFCAACAQQRLRLPPAARPRFLPRRVSRRREGDMSGACSGRPTPPSAHRSQARRAAGPVRRLRRRRKRVRGRARCPDAGRRGRTAPDEGQRRHRAAASASPAGARATASLTPRSGRASAGSLRRPRAPRPSRAG